MILCYFTLVYADFQKETSCIGLRVYYQKLTNFLKSNVNRNEEEYFRCNVSKQIGILSRYVFSYERTEPQLQGVDTNILGLRNKIAAFIAKL